MLVSTAAAFSKPASPAPTKSVKRCAAPRQHPPRPSNSAHPDSGPRLTLRGAAGDITEYPLGLSNVLGRSTTASVRLADREVSRKHSQIDREGETWVLRDLGSSNGTFLNGKRISGPAQLKDGDEVMIGTSRMEFRLSSGPVRPKNAEPQPLRTQLPGPERDGRAGDGSRRARQDRQRVGE